MKLYKYWVTEKQTILIDGAEQSIICYGGSNISAEDARVTAKEKAGISTPVNSSSRSARDTP